MSWVGECFYQIEEGIRTELTGSRRLTAGVLSIDVLFGTLVYVGQEYHVSEIISQKGLTGLRNIYSRRSERKV